MPRVSSGVIAVVACLGLLLGELSFAAPVAFEANVVAEEPTNTTARQSFRLWYDPMAPNTRLRNERSDGVKEIWDWAVNTSSNWIRCECDCFGDAILTPFPKIYSEPADSFAASDKECDFVVMKFDVRSGIKSMNFWANESICRVNWVNGTIWRFSNYLSAQGSHPNSFFDPSSLPCNPSPFICPESTDLVILLDGSGSITTAEWKSEQLIATKLSELYSKSKGRVGVIVFSDSITVAFYLTYASDVATLALSMIQFPGGSTCIGCGLDAAVSMLLALARPGVPRSILLFTDGMNTDNSVSLAGAIARANHTNNAILAVGFGNVDPRQIEAIASKINCTQTIYTPPSTTVDFSFPAYAFSCKAMIGPQPPQVCRICPALEADSTRSSLPVLAIILPAIVAACSLMLLILAFFLRKRRKHEQAQNAKPEIPLTQAHSSPLFIENRHREGTNPMAVDTVS